MELAKKRPSVRALVKSVAPIRETGLKRGDSTVLALVSLLGFPLSNLALLVVL